MKSGMNKLMSLCLVAMMGTTLIPQPIQAEEVSEFEEATVEFEEATFEEESNQVAESSVESNRKTPVVDTFDDGELKYQVTGADTVEVIGSVEEPRYVESLTIPSTVEHDNQTYYVTSIGQSAFEGSLSLGWVFLPEGLETIGESAFSGCGNVKQINLPEGLETIGESAFSGCRNVKQISFPTSLQTIGESAFKNCWRLLDAHLPEGITTIKRSTFENCDALQTVNLRKGLKTIGESAFKNCHRLKNVYLPEGLETIGESAFDLLPNELYHPCLSRMNIPSTVKELNHIFGKNSDDHTVTSPFKDKSILIFHGDELPIIDNEFFDLISGGENRPIIYFPENAIETYAGEKYPFVKAGLINPEFFDSYYEVIQLCPKNGVNDGVEIPKLHELSYDGSSILNLDLDYDQSILDCSTDFNHIFYISSKELTGETVFSYKVPLTVDSKRKKLISEESKIKFKVAHRYVWVIDKEATKDEPGSKYQYCVECKDAKEPVTIPPTGGGSGGGSTGGGSGGGSTGGSTSGGSGGGSSTGGGSTIDPNAPTPQVENAVYRAYNSSNGEHLYTTNYEEFKVITKNGWDDEGIAFMSESKEKGQAVYRVYNPNSGLHHYTTNVNEKNTLVSLGWNDEGVAFYTSKNPKDTPVYRVYNENDSNHHYTMDANEALALISMGWKNEGIAFFTTPMK